MLSIYRKFMLLIVFWEIVFFYKCVKYILFVFYVSTYVFVIFYFVYIFIKQLIIQKLISLQLYNVIFTLFIILFFMNLSNLNRILCYFLPFWALLYFNIVWYYLIMGPFKTYLFITKRKSMNWFLLLLKLFLNLFQNRIFKILFQLFAWFVKLFFIFIDLNIN